MDKAVLSIGSLAKIGGGSGGGDGDGEGGVGDGLGGGGLEGRMVAVSVVKVAAVAVVARVESEVDLAVVRLEAAHFHAMVCAPEAHRCDRQ